MNLLVEQRLKDAVRRLRLHGAEGDQLIIVQLGLLQQVPEVEDAPSVCEIR